MDGFFHETILKYIFSSFLNTILKIRDILIKFEFSHLLAISFCVKSWSFKITITGLFCAVIALHTKRWKHNESDPEPGLHRG